MLGLFLDLRIGSSDVIIWSKRLNEQFARISFLEVAHFAVSMRYLRAEPECLVTLIILSDIFLISLTISSIGLL